MNPTIKRLIKQCAVLVITPNAIYYACSGYMHLADGLYGYGQKLADDAYNSVVDKVDETLRGYGYSTPIRMSIEEKIEKEASNYGLDPKLVQAVIAVESRKNKWAKSHAGAMGLMQLMPETAKACGFEDAGEAYSQHANIECGTWWLARAIEDEGGDKRRGLQRYNGGPRCVGKCEESMKYADSVMKIYKGEETSLRTKIELKRKVIYAGS